VTGAGSTITNSGATTIGSVSGFNQLTIADGGKIVSSGAAVIGSPTTSGTNVVTVTGAGSVWTNAGNLTVAALVQATN